MKIHYSQGGGSFWTDLYGVHRWDPSLVTRPGTYGLIFNAVVLQLARMSVDKNCWVTHPTCVVDDFGSLVRVAA